MTGNRSLHAANRAKHDEFYTQLTDTESEFLGEIEKGTTYWQRSLIELTTPGLFFIFFSGLMWLGLRNLPQENFALFMFYPVFLLYFSFIT